MTWFNIIKYSVASNVEQMFPNAKTKLVGDIWVLLFNNEQDYYEAFELLTELKEIGDFDFGYGFDKNKKTWKIMFPNRELQGME